MAILMPPERNPGNEPVVTPQLPNADLVPDQARPLRQAQGDAAGESDKPLKRLPVH